MAVGEAKALSREGAAGESQTHPRIRSAVGAPQLLSGDRDGLANMDRALSEVPLMERRLGRRTSSARPAGAREDHAPPRQAAPPNLPPIPSHHPRRPSP